MSFVPAFPGINDEIDLATLSASHKAALFRYYAAEMVADLPDLYDCQVLTEVLRIPLGSDRLVMLEGWIPDAIRDLRYVDLNAVLNAFSEKCAAWGWDQGCGHDFHDQTSEEWSPEWEAS